MPGAIRYLMCPPDHYEVDYVINPWMGGECSPLFARTGAAAVAGSLSASLAAGGGEANPAGAGMAGYGVYGECWAHPGIQGGAEPVFYHPERQGEQPHFKAWFEEQGYTVYELPPALAFEGAGDALLDRAGRWLWAGYGFRSMLESHPYLAKWLGIEVLSLRLVDERFYHLDTCFCPLSEGYLLYYPPAFDAYSNRLIEMRVPPEKRIPVQEADAIHFACNAVDVNGTILVNRVSPELEATLQERGFAVVQTELTEFLKAGGAAKCLTLRLDETVAPQTDPVATVLSRTVTLQGHLVDSDLLTRAVDCIVDNGGSFQILKFQLGEKRQSTSTVELAVSAPTEETLDTILSALIEQGARLSEETQQDARLERVEKAGVAPDDFYVTHHLSHAGAGGRPSGSRCSGSAWMG
jgi:N-dimethylarginine dimethylaminohydrolase